MLPDENVNRFAKALYPVAFLLMLVPLADLALRTFPPQFGTLQWRFATVGLLLGNFGTVLLGLGLSGLIAAFAGHRTMLRTVGIVAFVLAALTLGVLVLFTLDAVQIRQLAAPNFKRSILTSSVGALFTGGFGTLALLVLGRGAMQASRPSRGAAAARARSTASKGAPTLVVANSGPSAGEAV